MKSNIIRSFLSDIGPISISDWDGPTHAEVDFISSSCPCGLFPLSAFVICVFYLSTDSISIPDVKNLNGNMSLGLTMTRGPAPTGLTVRVCRVEVCQSCICSHELALRALSVPLLCFPPSNIVMCAC